MFKKLSIRQKLALLVLVVFVGLASTSAFSLYALKQSQLDNRRGEVKNIVLTAVSIVGHFHSLAESGALDEAEAQRQALAAVEGMGYGKGGYFWVNDKRPYVLMHPKNKAIENVDLKAIPKSDKNGGKYKIYDNFVKQVNAGGGKSFIEYSHFRSTSATKKSYKISYLEEFKPWGWIIGSGVYMDELNEQFQQKAMMLIAEFLAVLLLVILIMLSISRNLSRQMASLANATREMTSGNMRAAIPHTDREDEIGQLARALEVFKTQAEEKEFLEEQSAQEQAKYEEERKAQMARTEEVIRLTREFESTIGSVMEAVSTSLMEMQDRVSESNASAQQGTEQTRHTNTVVQQVSGSVEKVGEVVSLIRSIAEQTNLLSLNAAIESARAGEAGRGFAVVADEVRKLATQTSTATDEIASQIEAVQNASFESVQEIEKVGGIIETNGQNADRMDSSIRDVVSQFESLQDAITRFVAALR